MTFAFGTVLLISLMAKSAFDGEREVMTISFGLCFASWMNVSMPRLTFPGAVVNYGLGLSQDMKAQTASYEDDLARKVRNIHIWCE